MAQSFESWCHRLHKMNWQRHMLNKLGARMSVEYVSKIFKEWAHVVSIFKQNQSTALRIVLRWQNNTKLASQLLVFDVWVWCSAVEKKHKLLTAQLHADKALIRWSRGYVAALDRWKERVLDSSQRSSCATRQAIQRQLHMCVLVSKSSVAILNRCHDCWKDTRSIRVLQRASAVNYFNPRMDFILRMQDILRRGAVRRWRLAMAELQRLPELIGNFVLRTDEAVLFKGFSTWTQQTSELKRQRVVMQKIVANMNIKSKAFVAWQLLAQKCN